MEDENCSNDNVDHVSNERSKIWRIIECDRKGNNKRFAIQSIPENRYGEAMDLFYDFYILEEPTGQYFDLKNDQLAIEDFRNEWREGLEKGLSIGVFLLGESRGECQMVAANILCHGSKERDSTFLETLTMKSSSARKMLEIFSSVHDEADVFSRYECESYLGCVGLVVHPNFRGYGLANHLLDVRTDIGRKLGVPITVSIFTGPFSQRAAEQAGYEVLLEKKFEQMIDKSSGTIFPNGESKVIKVMGKRL